MTQLLSKIATQATFYILNSNITLLDTLMEGSAAKVRVFETPIHPLTTRVGQIVSGIPHRGLDNYWQILPGEGSAPKDDLKLRNGDIIKLYHQDTDTNLLTHDVASPLSSTNEEFTAWPHNNTNRRDQEEEFQIHVLGAQEGEVVKSLASHFKLVHVDTGVSMFMSGKGLPSGWAPGKFEVNGKKDESEQGATWYIDEFEAHPEMKAESRQSGSTGKRVKSMSFFKKFFELVGVSYLHVALLIETQANQDAEA